MSAGVREPDWGWILTTWRRPKVSEPPSWATCSWRDGDLAEYSTTIGFVRSVETGETLAVDVVRFDTGLVVGPLLRGELRVRVGGHLLDPDGANELRALLTNAFGICGTSDNWSLPTS